MIPVFLSLIAVARVFFQIRTDIAVEVLALRHQVAVLKRKRPRPRLSPLDRLFWTVLRTTWSRWRAVLVIVKPETVVGWHRAGFCLYWRWKSRPRRGRRRITPELRALIRRLAQENSDWGAPRSMANRSGERVRKSKHAPRRLIFETRRFRLTAGKPAKVHEIRACRRSLSLSAPDRAPREGASLDEFQAGSLTFSLQRCSFG